MNSPATWFVTGTSRGLGRELVRQLLERGDNVAATTRSTARLRAALEAADTSRLLALEVNLADEAAVAAAVRAAEDRFGALDVVVNNAGYGYLAAVEKVTDAAARQIRATCGPTSCARSRSACPPPRSPGTRRSGR